MLRFLFFFFFFLLFLSLSLCFAPLLPLHLLLEYHVLTALIEREAKEKRRGARICLHG